MEYLIWYYNIGTYLYLYSGNTTIMFSDNEIIKGIDNSRFRPFDDWFNELEWIVNSFHWFQCIIRYVSKKESYYLSHSGPCSGAVILTMVVSEKGPAQWNISKMAEFPRVHLIQIVWNFSKITKFPWAKISVAPSGFVYATT